MRDLDTTGRRRTRITRRLVARAAIGGVVVALLGGAAAAVALSLTPGGGGPRSSYRVEVACDAEPRLYVRDLDAGRPPATLLPEAGGAEAAPGVWAYELRAGERDQVVSSQCGDAQERSRYDVELPVLLPGPTVVDVGSWRPELAGSTVVGTDCPADAEAVVTFRGAGGYEQQVTASADAYGDWEVPVPAAAPGGELSVDASCGAVTYDPIALGRGGAGPSSSIPGTTAPADPATPASPVAAPAEPVSGSPAYTG